MTWGPGKYDTAANQVRNSTKANGVGTMARGRTSPLSVDHPLPPVLIRGIEALHPLMIGIAGI